MGFRLGKVENVGIEDMAYFLFYLVAYLFSYHEKAINALYELA